jgi:hypothetical protein
MRRFVVAAATALLPLHLGFTQEASRTETETISEIVQCMAQGLPQDWMSAQMVVELERPGASTGTVHYLVARKDVEDRPEIFTPCESDAPPSLLLGLRAQQPEDRRGWTRARLVIERDGTFRLNYDFAR